MKKFIARFKRRQLLLPTSLLAVDLLVFGTTNPRSVPSWLLAAGFLLFCLTSYSIFRALLAIPGVYGFSIRHKRRLLRTLTILTGSLVALQSIGQLESRDVLVLSLLTMLLYLYSAYTKSLRQNLPTRQL